MIRKIIYLLLLFTGIACTQQTGSKLEITLHTPPVDISEKVYIAGNDSSIGNWHPSRIPLTRINDSTWHFAQVYQPGKSLEFKFTRGAWEAEAVNERGEVPPNYSITVFGDTAVLYTVANWRDKVEDIEVFRGGITGHVEYIRDLKFEFLPPRDVIVWLPPGYDKSDENYPVLYMHDGQNLVDPATSSFGVDWQIDETADSLIRQGVISPFILVGINNTVARNTEYMNTDTGFVYVKFVSEYLKPMIDKKYRTRPGRDYTFTGGASMGGIISMIIAWERSDIFGGAICFSPAFKISHIDYVKPVSKYSGSKKDLKILVYNGGVGLEQELQPGVDEMINVLEQKGFVIGKDLSYKIFPDDAHGEVAWARQIPEALEFIPGKLK